jgi:hypothetical protein
MVNYLIFSLAIGAVVCAATPSSNLRKESIIETRANQYSLPNGGFVRAAAVSAKRLGFTYGPDPAGTAIYYPSGVLGLVRSTADFVALDLDAVPHIAKVEVDGVAAGLAVTLVSIQLP